MKKSLLRIAVAFVMLGLLAGFLPTAALANGETYDVAPYKTAGTYPTSDGKVLRVGSKMRLLPFRIRL